jgi:hypothetical protein
MMKQPQSSIIFFALGSIFLSACTGQLLDSFRYQNSAESFKSETEINTKIDLLWVVDNSSSMDIAQKNIREKVAGFTERYLSPNWDIRIGVITTDTYMANPVFENYVSSVVPGSLNFRSKHLNDLIQLRSDLGLTPANDSKLEKLQAMNVSLSGLTRGAFLSGYRYQDLVPAWGAGSDYARLLPGLRDGPITGLCMERQAYFFAPNLVLNPLIIGPDCGVRDAANRTGTATCLAPENGQLSVSECVNTTLNDTVRSENPIINTRLPDGVSDVTAWKQKLVDDFIINLSVGTVGGGSERGLSSIDEFISVNESSETQFFRAGSLRSIIILTDEDDQSLFLPPANNIPVGFDPFTDYQCDLDALVEANADKFIDAETYISSTFAYCCAGDSCRFKNLGCPSKIVDGVEVKVGVCPAENKLQPIEDFKTRWENYFNSLDDHQDTAMNGETANYFVVAIAPIKASTISSLREERYESDDRLDDIILYNSLGDLVKTKRIRIPAVDYAERYLLLAEAVGQGSLVLDIGEPDYSVILDHIGKTLIERKSTFELKFEPTQKKDILIKIIRESGQEEIVLESQYEFSGKTLTITDESLVLSLKSTDRLLIDYQPSSLD